MTTETLAQTADRLADEAMAETIIGPDGWRRPVGVPMPEPDPLDVIADAIRASGLLPRRVSMETALAQAIESALYLAGYELPTPDRRARELIDSHGETVDPATMSPLYRASVRRA